MSIAEIRLLFTVYLLCYVLLPGAQGTDARENARDKAHRPVKPGTPTDEGMSRVITSLTGAMQTETKQIKAPRQATADTSDEEQNLLKPEEVNTFAITLGGWVKKRIDALKAIPDEEDNSNSNNKTKEQQASLQELKTPRKEEQSAARAHEPSRNEVFAAGMAAGNTVIDSLETRQQQGITFPAREFIAGVTEALKGGKSLSQGEIQRLLISLSDRVAMVMKKRQQQRRQRGTGNTMDPGIQNYKDSASHQKINSDRENECGVAGEMDKGVTSENVISRKARPAKIEDNTSSIQKRMMNMLDTQDEADIVTPALARNTPSLKGPFIEM